MKQYFRKYSWNIKAFFSGLVIVAIGLVGTPFVEAEGFKDIQNSPYKESIEYVQSQRIVEGYAGGRFRPRQSVNRAEFTKILVGAISGPVVLDKEPCFTDLKKSDWFTPFVCTAKEMNILTGYPDGSFKPDHFINFAEASKILANAFQIPPVSSEGAWYTGFVLALEKQGNIPKTIGSMNDVLTREELAEMIMRARERISNRESQSACDLSSEFCPGGALNGFGDEHLVGVDMEMVRATWLGWMNAEREILGLSPYTYNSRLNDSAYRWSEISLQHGYIDHKRDGQTAYYDYQIIAQWFKDLGLVFENVFRVTFSENIGWGYFRCSVADCSQEMINALRPTFDFYMAEKWKASAPHYNSMTNKYFKEIGLGITNDKKNGKLYITTHYGTKIL